MFFGSNPTFNMINQWALDYFPLPGHECYIEPNGSLWRYETKFHLLSPHVLIGGTNQLMFVASRRIAHI
jgi:hypothetical protein